MIINSTTHFVFFITYLLQYIIPENQVFPSQPQSPFDLPNRYFNFRKSFFFTSTQYSPGTECPTIYRKSVLHLLKYRFTVYISRYSTHLRQILRHSVHIGIYQRNTQLFPIWLEYSLSIFQELSLVDIKNRESFLGNFSPAVFLCPPDFPHILFVQEVVTHFMQ